MRRGDLVGAARVARLFGRLVLVIALALLVGRGGGRLAALVDEKKQPAGFFSGMAQGAVMPMAMPNLLLGRDIAIYARENSGVPYKLGYTLGVNLCGALFFGGFFWRVQRWRASRAPASKAR